MRWPGAVYDGDAALARYREKITHTARELGIVASLREEPIHSQAEAEQWADEAQAAAPDGLLVVLLDRQEHAWPTAARAADTHIPTVVFCPVGAAFTTNTKELAARSGLFICSTDDFAQVAYGMKMLWAGAKLREMRFVVLRGDQRSETTLDHLGTKVRYVPASDFLEQYRRTPLSDDVKKLATYYLDRPRRDGVAPSDEDIYNGIKSYVVARQILEREDGDGISMDCLGALGRTDVSLPCIAWSRMLDDGIPAACEADLGACATHALIQFLFDRPGFQQDPVPETARECLIGAHCTCPTRLNGFVADPEPFVMSHHHGLRDAVPVPRWRPGQRMTSADIVFRPPLEQGGTEVKQAPQLIVSSGIVVDNVSVPPAGGCVVSVMVKFDGVKDYLAYPGFHQVFFYGDYKKELAAYGRLFDLELEMV
jgi:hypothetical protein